MGKMTASRAKEIPLKGKMLGTSAGFFPFFYRCASDATDQHGRRATLLERWSLGHSGRLIRSNVFWWDQRREERNTREMPRI